MERKGAPVAPTPAPQFIDKGAYDPLRHACADLFWFHVEPSFHPFVADDVASLHGLAPGGAVGGGREAAHAVTVPEGLRERERRASQGDTAPVDEAVAARTRSFPITQRLIAAFLDEGKGAGSAARALRQNPAPEPAWLPGSLPEMRSFNRILESRIKAELQSVGLLAPDDDDEVAEAIRLDQWHLRNLMTGNTPTHRHLQKHLSDELKVQAKRREDKRKFDLIEVQYLKKMMETGGKRGRSRYSKILTSMHPHRDIEVGAPMPRSGKAGGANGTGDTSNTQERKKKKRKSNAYHNDRHKSKASFAVSPAAKDGAHAGGGGDIAPHIAEIIERHGNAASLDTIVNEFLKTGPHLGLDPSDTRTKIQKMIAFSRKPYRFPKHPDKKTFSVEKVL